MSFPIFPIAARITALACVSLLCGCIELVPRHVEQTLSIDQDGRVDVVYQGQFQDLAELAKVIAEIKKDKLPDFAAHRRSTLDDLRRNPGFDEVSEVEPHIYRFRWREKAVLKSGRIPEMLKLHHGDENIPRLLSMSGFRQLSGNAYMLENIEYVDLEQDSLPEDHRLTRVINGYVKRFNGTVRVDIDSAMVLKHNAASVREMPGGRLLLEWSLSFPVASNSVKLVFTLDKRDLPAFKLMDSPPGSSCIELIGSQCKCGPFTIMDHMGNPQAYARYEIRSPAGVRQGCTDENGKTVKIESAVTGTCTVKLFPEMDAKEKCGPRSVGSGDAAGHYAHGSYVSTTRKPVSDGGFTCSGSSISVIRSAQS